MERADERRALRLLAGGSAMVVGLVHLAHPTAGFPRFVQLVAIGHPLLEPRPIAFTLSGIAVVVGVLAVWNGFLGRREAQLGGMALMATFVVGYVLWHMTGHGAWWPAHPGEAVFHPGNPLRVLLDHILIDPWALVATVAEVTTFGLLAYLHLGEGRTGSA